MQGDGPDTDFIFMEGYSVSWMDWEFSEGDIRLLIGFQYLFQWTDWLKVAPSSLPYLLCVIYNTWQLLMGHSIQKKNTTL